MNSADKTRLRAKRKLEQGTCSSFRTYFNFFLLWAFSTRTFCHALGLSLGFNDYALSRRCLSFCIEHVLLISLPTREIVLGRLVALVKSFVNAVSRARGLSEAAAETAGGKIFTFGSYCLGAHGPGSDIDMLCVVPKHVSREDFFDVFEGMLRNTEGVTEVLVSYLEISTMVAAEPSVVGDSQSIRSHHQVENLGHPNRFSHGPSCAIVNTGRPDITG